MKCERKKKKPCEKEKRVRGKSERQKRDPLDVWPHPPARIPYMARGLLCGLGFRRGLALGGRALALHVGERGAKRRGLRVQLDRVRGRGRMKLLAQ